MKVQDVLLAYSEYLDGEGLVLTRPSDKRTHDDLVKAFIEDHTERDTPIARWTMAVNFDSTQEGSDDEEAEVKRVLLNIARGETKAPPYEDGSGDQVTATLDQRIRACEAILGDSPTVIIAKEMWNNED